MGLPGQVSTLLWEQFDCLAPFHLDILILIWGQMQRWAVLSWVQGRAEGLCPAECLPVLLWFVCFSAVVVL